MGVQYLQPWQRVHARRQRTQHVPRQEEFPEIHEPFHGGRKRRELVVARVKDLQPRAAEHLVRGAYRLPSQFLF